MALNTVVLSAIYAECHLCLVSKINPIMLSVMAPLKQYEQR
jgi:hypothetical protein